MKKTINYEDLCEIALVRAFNNAIFEIELLKVDIESGKIQADEKQFLAPYRTNCEEIYDVIIKKCVSPMLTFKTEKNIWSTMVSWHVSWSLFLNSLKPRDKKRLDRLEKIYFEKGKCEEFESIRPTRKIEIVDKPEQKEESDQR